MKFLILLSIFFITPSLFAVAIPYPSGTNEDILAAINSVVEKKDTSKSTRLVLEKIIRDESANIRLKEYAAWALGRLNAREAVNALVIAAKHKSLLVRSAGLNGLMHMRARTGLPVYIDIFQNDPVLSLRQRAVIAMGMLRWEKTIETLVKASEDPKVEVRAAAALAMAGTHSSRNDFREILKEMTADESPYVQEKAKAALTIANRNHGEIRSLLKSPDEDIRLFAALFFHFHGTANDLSHVKTAYDGEANDEVRYELTLAKKAIEKDIAKEKARKAKEEKLRQEKLRKEKLEKEKQNQTGQP